MAPVRWHLLEALQSIFPDYESVCASFYNLLGKALGYSATTAKSINSPTPWSVHMYCGFLIGHCWPQLRSWENA